MNKWGISANRLTNHASGAVVGVKLEPFGLEVWETQDIPQRESMAPGKITFLFNGKVAQSNERKYM